MRKSYRGLSIHASCKMLLYLAKWFQRRRFFRNWPTRNKNCLWRQSLLINQDNMSNLYREPSIDASYQVSVHLAKRFQRRRFLEIDQPETRIAYSGHVCLQVATKWAIFYREPSIDASYKVSVHLAKLFQKRKFYRNWSTINKNCLSRPCLFPEEKIKMWKVNGWQTPSDGKSSYCLFQGEPKMNFLSQFSQSIKCKRLFISGL